MWLGAMVHAYFSVYALLFKNHSENIDWWIITLRKIAMFQSIMIGLVISIVRMREPYFTFLIKQEFLSWFGILVEEEVVSNPIIPNEEEEQEEDVVGRESLAALLQSQLNIELVNIILQSISSHCKGKVPSGVIYKDFEKIDYQRANDFKLKEI